MGLVPDASTHRPLWDPGPPTSRAVALRGWGVTRPPSPQPSAQYPVPHRAGPAILGRPGLGGVVAMVAMSFALRAPITAIPPVVSDLEDALGVSSGAIALLTSIPVLCFGLITPASSTLLRVLGLRVSGAICLVGVVAGSILRSGGSFALALLGTFLIGAAISIGNLVVPVLIGRAYPMRAPVLMGVYSSAMNVGSTAATAATAALAITFGWQLATASWGVVLGGVGVAAWVWLLPRAAVHSAARSAPSSSSSSRAAGAAERRAGTRQTLRSGVAWLLAAAFAAQAMSWYAITAWLPSALRDVVGMSQAGAGVAASAFQVAGIAGPLLVPAFLAAARRRWANPAGAGGHAPDDRDLRERHDDAALVAVLVGLWATMPVGMLLAPQWWLAWSLLSGVAQGGFFTMIFLLVVRRTRSDDENRRTAALVQTVGYLAAATAPVLVGVVHERVPGWTVLFAMVGVLVVVMGAGALTAALRVPSGARPPTAAAGRMDQ